jgi:hypothetical protein
VHAPLPEMDAAQVSDMLDRYQCVYVRYACHVGYTLLCQSMHAVEVSVYAGQVLMYVCICTFMLCVHCRLLCQ